MENITESPIEFNTALVQHNELHKTKSCTAESVKQWPHGQSASVTTTQPHIVPCVNMFGWHLNQLRWLKLDRAHAMVVLHTEKLSN